MEIACCGLDCRECAVYLASVNGDTNRQEELAKEYSTESHRFSKEDMFCQGCHSDTVSEKMCGDCEIRKCGIEGFLFLTERCRIRFFQEKDMDAFMAYRNDLEWMKYQGFKGLSKQEYEQALLCIPDYEKGVQLAVADAEDRLIGDLYVKESEKATEIGFTISPAFSGQGYAKEAVAGLLAYKRSVSGKRIIAETQPENLASVRLLKKLGFREDGVYDGWVRFVLI